MLTVVDAFALRQPPDYDRAIAEFRRSLERDPRHEQTLQNLVFALTKQFLPSLSDLLGLPMPGMEQMVKLFGTWPWWLAVLVPALIRSIQSRRNLRTSAIVRWPRSAAVQ